MRAPGDRHRLARGLDHAADQCWTATSRADRMAGRRLTHLPVGRRGRTPARHGRRSLRCGQPSGVRVRGPRHHTMREQARTTPAMAEYTALWKGGLPDAPDWLAEHRWRPEVHNRAEVTARYGRVVSGLSAGGFVTATRA